MNRRRTVRLSDLPAITMVAEFVPSGDHVRMVVTLDPMHDEEMTRMSTMGFTSQLSKLDKRFSG